MASDLELVHLAFNRLKKLSLIYDDSIPHLISIFQRTRPRRFIADANDRRRGKNPMSDSYTEEVNKKRTDLGVSILSSKGLDTDQSGMRKFEEIAEGCLTQS
jgi:hypothetical protein